MRRPGVLVAALLLATGTPAAADYVFDPKDLPADFVCSPKLSAEDCEDQKRSDAWAEIYFDRSDYWYESLLFDVNIYFTDEASALSDPAGLDLSLPQLDRLGYETPNLVDVVYSIALRRYGGWAFAIDRNAQMRLVRPRTDDEIDKAAAKRFVSWLPTSLAETAEPLPVFYVFEEADLTRCKGAIAQLKAFPMQRGEPLWSGKELDWVSGKAEPAGDDLLITADGDGVLVRARGVPRRGRPLRSVGEPIIVYDQWNYGDAYEWAKAMEKAARPCLKPSTATPPWEKLVNANIERVED